MKKLISLILSFLLLFSLVSCEKEQNNSNSSKGIPQSSVATNETILNNEQTLFADHNSECNYENYKEIYYNDEYSYSLKYPNSWEAYPIDVDEWLELFGESPTHTGVQLFNGPLPEYFEPVGGTVFIAESSTGFNDYYGNDKSDYYEFFTTTNGYKLRIYYNEQKQPVYIKFLDYSSLCVFLQLEETQDIQEIVNIINSIEIIDKSIKFYDFSYSREEALITNENDFYDQNVLSDLKSRFKDDIINFVQKNFSEKSAKDYTNQITNLSPEFYSAVTDDFNGDGENESFVVMTYKDLLYSFEPASILYLIDSKGNQSVVAIENHIDLGLISYPNQKQLTYITDYGTGLSYHENIYSYDGEKVSLLKTVNTSDFEKDGPFLATYPRVGSAGEVLPRFYYWVSKESKYYEVPYVKIPLNRFNNVDINKKLCESLEEKYVMTVSGVATLAYKYYVIELTDNENNKNISIFKRGENGYEQFEYADEIFPYSLSYFAIEGDVEIDYGYANTLAI